MRRPRRRRCRHLPVSSRHAACEDDGAANYTWPPCRGTLARARGGCARTVPRVACTPCCEHARLRRLLRHLRNGQGHAGPSRPRWSLEPPCIRRHSMPRLSQHLHSNGGREAGEASLLVFPPLSHSSPYATPHFPHISPGVFFSERRVFSLVHFFPICHSPFPCIAAIAFSQFHFPNSASSVSWCALARLHAR